MVDVFDQHLENLGVIGWVVIILLYPSFSHAELKGKYRDGFIRHYIKSCYAKQKSVYTDDTYNSGITLLCTCMATYSSDRLDLDSLNDLTNGIQQGKPPAWYLKVLSKGEEHCQKHANEYK